MSTGETDNAHLLAQMLELMQTSGMDLSAADASGIGGAASGNAAIDRLAALLKPQETADETANAVNDERLARQKEKWALRDFFVEQATKQREELGLAKMTREEYLAVAADLRYDYVDRVHSILEQVKSLSAYSWYVAVLGVFLMVAAREVDWYFDGQMPTVVLGLRCGNSLVTVLLIYLIYLFHRNEFLYDKLNQGYLNELSGVFAWQAWRQRSFFIEVCICAIHDFPFASWFGDISVDASQSPYFRGYFLTDYVFVPALLDAPWSLLMVFRIYLMPRYWRDQEFSAGANVLAIFSNFPFNTDFATRAILDGNAFGTLAYMLLLLILCSSYIFHVCERTTDPHFYSSGCSTDEVTGECLFDEAKRVGTWTKSYVGHAWLSFITLTTIGYGDNLPLTYCGRSVSIITVIIGIAIVSGLTGALNGMLAMPPFESKMTDFMALMELRIGRLHSAARVISKTYRFHKARRRVADLVHRLAADAAEEERLEREREKRARRAGAANSSADDDGADLGGDDRICGYVRDLGDLMVARLRVQQRHVQLYAELMFFNTTRNDLVNYTQRFAPQAHITIVLEKISHKMALVDDLTIGADRDDKYVSNNIVNQMVQLFARQIDRHAAAAGMMGVGGVKSMADDEEDDDDDDFEAEQDDIEAAAADKRLQGYVDPYKEKYRRFGDGTKRMTKNMQRLDSARAAQYAKAEQADAAKRRGESVGTTGGRRLKEGEKPDGPLDARLRKVRAVLRAAEQRLAARAAALEAERAGIVVADVGVDADAASGGGGGSNDPSPRLFASVATSSSSSSSSSKHVALKGGDDDEDVHPANQPPLSLAAVAKNKAALAALGKKLSSGDVAALNTMLDQASANPGVLAAGNAPAGKKRKRRRWHRPAGAHHHHHHLHGNLPPPPSLSAIPTLLEGMSAMEELEAELMRILTMTQTAAAGLSTVATRVIRLERDVRSAVRESTEFEFPQPDDDDGDDLDALNGADEKRE